MEIWMIGMLAAVWLGVGAQTVLLAKALRHTETPRTEPAVQETEEERLLREVQQQYEQGFVNLMRYDGSPGRKERDRQ